MQVGVLALQGNFANHAEKAALFGHQAYLVKNAKDLSSIDALVMPGGESTTMLKLLTTDFIEALIEKVATGIPTLATCAGCILAANSVKNSAQKTFGLIDIEIERNAYGSQIDSFITDALQWEIETTLPTPEGVFIRAPKICSVGQDVRPVLRNHDEIVCVQSKNIIAATFHPEMSAGKNPLLEYFYTCRAES